MRKQFCVVRAYRPVRCARGLPPSLWTLVGRPAAAEEEGRKGWRWLTRAVDGWRGLGEGGEAVLWTFTLRCLSPTHTHTHTHFSSSWSSSGTVTCTPYPQKLTATVSAINRSQASTTRDCSLSISCTSHLITLVSLPHPPPTQAEHWPMVRIFWWVSFSHTPRISQLLAVWLTTTAELLCQLPQEVR